MCGLSAREVSGERMERGEIEIQALRDRMGGASDEEERLMKRGGGSKRDDDRGNRTFRTTRAKFIRVGDNLRRGVGEACASGTPTPLCRGNLDDSVPGGGLRFGVVEYRGYRSGEA